MNPRLYRHHEPSDAMTSAYEGANRRLESERGLPSGFCASGRRLSSKRALRDLLRDAGLSKAASERIATAGWSALSPEAAAADAVASIRAATEQLKRFK